MVRFFGYLLRPFFILLDVLTPLADLAARAWVAWVFFQAGLIKIQAWQSTLVLFQNEYTVPYFSSDMAARIATGAELILPVLLFLGLGSRLMIALFFTYNLVAMCSYPYLWTAEGAAGLAQHINWGLLLALLMCHGPGKLSIDHWIRQRHGAHLKKGNTDVRTD